MCREGFSIPTTPVRIDTFKLNVVFEKWFKNSFKNMIFKINYFANIYLFFYNFFLWTIRANYRGSIALNTSNTIKIFNTINRTSRFPTRDYCDVVEIHRRKFTRIIQSIIRDFLLIILTFYSTPFWNKISIFI